MTVEARSIGRFHASYRLAPAELDARARLDALLERVLDAALDGALARAGVAPDEEVCVRSVAGDARLRLASTDSELVSAWSGALAAALAEAIAAGEPLAVRYRSRRQALVDLAVSTAAGDLQRAWAWRQLGLWPGEEPEPVDGTAAVARLVDALTAEPRSIVPVLVAVARRGALPRLAVLVTAGDWQRLARAALAAAGLTDHVLVASGLAGDILAASGLAEPELREPPAEHLAESSMAGSRAQEAAARARLLFSSSALATAAAGSGASVGLAPASRRALAVLVALEADPGSLAAAAGPAAAALVDALAGELDLPPDRPRRSEGEHRRRSTDSRSALASAGVEPESPSAGAADIPESDVEGERLSDEVGGVPEVRAVAWTEAGGLLFLLPLVAEVQPLELRTLRWTLHRLSLVLLPELDEADPAALAFAGLGPDEPPPSDEGEPATDAELDRLAAVARELELRLAERLDRRPEPGLLAAVCARRAEIVAEPGWIEVHLALEQLDIDVRRAGLDVDPGWLPWLGVVLRFVYA